MRGHDWRRGSWSLVLKPQLVRCRASVGYIRAGMGELLPLAPELGFDTRSPEANMRDQIATAGGIQARAPFTTHDSSPLNGRRCMPQQWDERAKLWRYFSTALRLPTLSIGIRTGCTGSLLRFGLVVLIAFLTGNEALGCRAPSSRMTIFLDQVPPRGDAQLIARVTIIKLVGVAEYTLPDGTQFSFAGIAHLDSVINGPIRSGTIKIVSPGSDCNIPFHVGSAGIVAGDVRHDASGHLELLAKAQYLDPDMRQRFPGLLGNERDPGHGIAR